MWICSQCLLCGVCAGQYGPGLRAEPPTAPKAQGDQDTFSAQVSLPPQSPLLGLTVAGPSVCAHGVPSLPSVHAGKNAWHIATNHDLGRWRASTHLLGPGTQPEPGVAWPRVPWAGQTAMESLRAGDAPRCTPLSCSASCPAPAEGQPVPGSLHPRGKPRRAPGPDLVMWPSGMTQWTEEHSVTAFQ